MKVLTYNIMGNKGRRKPGHLEAIADLIKRTGADVVGLQEVVHYRIDPQPPEQRLAALTGMHATYLPAHEFRRYTLGNAVLCCQPIQETVSHELPYSWPERRILLEVKTVSADGLPVTVFCTHLVHMARMAARIRTAQIGAIAKRMSTCFRPHLLMGDLNTGPASQELDAVRKISADDDHLNGLRSWPARRPFVLYDHIWPGPGWAIEKLEVLDLHVSDHRPLFAQLGWKGAPRYDVKPDEAYRAPAEQNLTP
jgi:endonuclease/exonuclease/phosphatase family metal-dependent hydrolase